MYMPPHGINFFFGKLESAQGRMSDRILDSKPYEALDQKYSIFPSIAAEDFY